MIDSVIRFFSKENPEKELYRIILNDEGVEARKNGEILGWEHVVGIIHTERILKADFN